MRPRSITARLTLLFSVASTLALLVFGHIVGTLVATHFEMLDRDELDGKLQLVRHVIEKAPGNGDLAPMRNELADALVGHRGLSVIVSVPGTPPLFAYGDAGIGAALIESAAANQPSATPVARTVEHAGRVFRGIVAPADVRAQGQGRTIVAVVLDVSHHRDFIAQFRTRLWLAIAAGAGLAALFGWFAARRGLAPLREMARVAKGVSASRLGSRLRAESLPDELIDLAAAFNDMLARLEDSFRRLSEFSSDLAHELRTPISNLMTETQVALSRVRSADEYREVLYSNLGEHERLARTITDMLYLAHADHGLLVPDTGRIDLSLEVRELFAFYEALAEERSVGLSLSGEGIVAGDRLMMRRALSNLLSNALRHTPPEATSRCRSTPAAMARFACASRTRGRRSLPNICRGCSIASIESMRRAPRKATAPVSGSRSRRRSWRPIEGGSASPRSTAGRASKSSCPVRPRPIAAQAPHPKRREPTDGQRRCDLGVRRRVRRGRS
ncbi:MAG: heavy metal sensor histidine kinase [Burkholderiaceae bacterium]|nr:heavy metal sensor histidine kinase [Burkholderiaceae bacterium]